MKKLFLSYKAITAALTMGLAAITTSCSQDIDNNNNASLKGNKAESAKIVKLSFGPHTRGTMYDDISQMADNATFGVYGYARKDNDPICKNPNFINNGSAEKKDGIVRVNGEVATYKESMPKVKIAAVYPKLEDNAFTRTGENTYTLTYALKEDMSTQQDLLIGEAPEFTIKSENSKNDLIDGKQTVDMHHALTAINFAIGDHVPTGYTIEGIRLTGLYTKGTCKVDLSNTNTTDADRFKWEDLSEKKDVYIKTNHITTTQVNRTQFTGLKTSDNKYDNLTIFMIPQQVGDDAKAEVILKKDGKEYVSVKGQKGEKVTPENDTRVKIKRIIIPLKRKDGKSYQAGEVEKYLVNSLINKTNEKDSNIDLKVVDPNNYEKSGTSIKPTKDKYSYCKKDGKKQNTYNVFIDCYRYAVNTNKTKKLFNYAIIAPNTFKIKSVTYLTYEIKKEIKKVKVKVKEGEKEVKKEVEKEVEIGKQIPYDMKGVKWEITKQPNGNNTIGSFSLTFNPDDYPMVTDKPKNDKKDKTKLILPKPRKLGLKSGDSFIITLVADGFEDKEFKITCTDFPK